MWDNKTNLRHTISTTQSSQMLSNTGINKIILLGQIFKEPQTNTTSNNHKYWCLILVTNEVIKKGQDTVEHNEYHNIRIPDKLITQDYLSLSVGQTLYVEGKIQTTSYVDEQRVKRYNLEILANKVELLSPVAVTA